ncbi:hypothetical protein SDC9_145001 [bioreactor metagenome]|uniref:Uncharacterized protein n=1 Tax=bioreactor metagenome TaxID=1076179 RepID=A0A645E8R2_9ZZZZ
MMTALAAVVSLLAVMNAIDVSESAMPPMSVLLFRRILKLRRYRHIIIYARKPRRPTIAIALNGINLMQTPPMLHNVAAIAR